MRLSVAIVMLCAIARPGAAEEEDVTWMVAVGGSLDLPLSRHEWLTEVGPALQVQAGVLIRADTERAAQLPLFVRYSARRTTFELGGSEPESRVRHDFGVGFGYLVDNTRLSPGFVWFSETRVGGGTFTLGADAGPVLRVSGPGPTALWLAALASGALSVIGAERSDRLGLQLGVQLAGEMAP